MGSDLHRESHDSHIADIAPPEFSHRSIRIGEVEAQ